MNYQLVHYWDTFCVSEGSLSLILKREMIQKFQNESTEARSLQDLHKLRNESLIANLHPDLLIE